MTSHLVLAVQNAPVLRALHAGGFASAAAMAASIDRDKDNFRKTLKLLETAGWADARALALTAEGIALLPRLAVLEGGAPGEAGDPRTLAHTQIAASPLNPRKDWTSDDAVTALDALRESILQEGLMQPIVVRREPDANGVRILMAGERRWRAIGMAIGDGDLPADHAIDVVLRDGDDDTHRRLALIENLVRQDLHPLDEARAFAELSGIMGTAALADLAKRTPRFIQQRIALLRLDDDVQDRMRLPADDPRHLTVTGARNLLQGRAETGGAGDGLGAMTLAQLVTADTPEAEAELQRRAGEGLAAQRRAQDPGPPDATRDIEELAPRVLDLTPAQALILFEVEAAAKARPAISSLGPAAKLESWVDLERAPDAGKLAREGLLVFSPQYPYKVTLMPSGAAWLGRQPGAFMQDEHRLRQARREASSTDARIAELEAESEFATAWLNVSRPPPILKPDARLVLIKLEIDEAKASQGVTDYQPAKYRPELAPPDLAEIATVTGPDSTDGVPRVRPPHISYGAMQQHHPDWQTRKGRREWIAGLRMDLDITGEDKGFAPKWLRGPFDPDPAWAAREAERSAEVARRAESAAAWEAAQEIVHLALDALEQAEAARLPALIRGSRLAEIAAQARLQGPWRPHDGGYMGGDRVAAASAGDVALKMSPGSISLRLALIGFNIATGVDPAAWPATRERADPDDDAERSLDRDAYVAAGAERLMVDHDSVDWDRFECRRRFSAHLDRWLEEQKIAFGAKGYDWTAADAREDADHLVDDFHAEVADEEINPA